MVYQEHYLIQSLHILVVILILYSLPTLQIAFLLFKIFLLQFRVVKGVEPASMEIPETRLKAILKVGIIEHGRPECLERYIKQIVKVK